MSDPPTSPFARWLPSGHSLQVAIAAMTLVLCGGALLWRRTENAALLRADPALLPQNAALMRFAAGRGRTLYASHCATCHGEGARGDAARGVPDLADADWLYGDGLIGDIERVVTYGIRSGNPRGWNLAVMPAYARARPSSTDPRMPPLSPGEIRDVVEYLFALQSQPVDAAAAARGARVYGETGGCYDCHSADARGDAAIGAPNLADDITLFGDGSRQALFDSVAYGHQGVCPAWYRRLSPVEIREISAYVYSISRRRAYAGTG